MSENVPRKHHTVSAGYVRRFAGATRHGYQVTVRHREKGQYNEGPGGVGYQLDYWGPPDLAAEVEAMFMRSESDALRLLRDLPNRWPLTPGDRAAVGQFLAAHVVRTPSFSAYLRWLGEKIAREVLAEGAVKHNLDETQVAGYRDLFGGSRMHARSLLGQLPRIGSVLCSMHWSVIEFDDDWLISCDQPVVFLPGTLHPPSPASAVPPLGVTGTVEARFTLDPRHVLLLTWYEEEPEPWLTGTREQACSINCALEAQALEEWFFCPATVPPFHSLPLLRKQVFAISSQLLPDYGIQRATASRRRRDAERIAIRMAEEQTASNEMRWARPVHRPRTGARWY